MPKIEIVNRQSKFRINRKDIIRAVELVLGSVRRKSAGVNVVFVDNKTIKKLNRQFLRHDYITDVIAFPFDDAEFYYTWRSASRSYRDNDLDEKHAIGGVSNGVHPYFI